MQSSAPPLPILIPLPQTPNLLLSLFLLQFYWGSLSLYIYIYIYICTVQICHLTVGAVGAVEVGAETVGSSTNPEAAGKQMGSTKCHAAHVD